MPALTVSLVHALSRVAGIAALVHTARFAAECVYARLCAPPPSWRGYWISLLVSNGDACTGLRHLCMLLGDVSRSYATWALLASARIVGG